MFAPRVDVDTLLYQNPKANPNWVLEGQSQSPKQTIDVECTWPTHTGNKEKVVMPAGSCLLFDDRILHRGLGNFSQKDRHVAYFSYGRKGHYVDYFDSTRSVFDNAA